MTNSIIDQFKNSTIVPVNPDGNLFKLVGVPTLLSLLVITLSLLFFGLAVHKGWSEELAPRSANRPKAVMKNALLYDNSVTFLPVALISWAYHLTLKECIMGVKGTGCRNNGFDGNLLTVNLDGIILMKYQTLLFKVSVLIAGLCTIILLPVYKTASCDNEIFGTGSCLQHNNITGFRELTIENIPNKVFNNLTDQVMTSELSSNMFNIGNIFGSSPDCNVGLGLKYTNGTQSKCDNLVYSMSKLWVQDQTWRIATTLICCLVIYSYTLYLLTQEWIENIALRRIFFLEAAHFPLRYHELNKLEKDMDHRRTGVTETSVRIFDQPEDQNTNEHRHKDDNRNTNENKNLNHLNCQYQPTEMNESSNHVETEQQQHEISIDDFAVFNTQKNGNAIDIEEANSNRRLDDTINTEDLPQFITHPEIRETPPSVGVYSVLFELPRSMITYDTEGATALERQLVATTNFFDEIIPAQPGFSSSVVAVSMLPKASLVALTWNKWVACELKLQNIRRIRREMKRLKTEQDEESSKLNSSNTNGVVPCGNENNSIVRKCTSLYDEVSFTYDDFDVLEYAKHLGFCEEVENMHSFINGMGIEEFSVFAYQSALLAGGCGCGHVSTQKCDLDTLKDEEQDLLAELKIANKELIDARVRVVQNDDDSELGSNNNSVVQRVFHQENDFTQIQNDLNCGSGDSSISNCHVSSLRHRTNTSRFSTTHYATEQWNLSVREAGIMNGTVGYETKDNSTIKMNAFTFLKRIYKGKENTVTAVPKHYGCKPDNEEATAFITDTEHPSYAVITFTSRHSAIIARQCLADGGAINSWKKVDDIPIYPLADAPQLMCFCRGCCRPVTPTISYTSKKIRRWIVMICFCTFAVFWTVPIQIINIKILRPELWRNVSNTIGLNLTLSQTELFTTTVSGLLQTLIFSVCPVFFKYLAYIEGSSSSMAKAEQTALMLFWYFYIIARFFGTILVVAAIDYFNSNNSTKIEKIVSKSISELGQEAPYTLGLSALSFIIVAAGVFPLLYMVNCNNFLTKITRLRWLNRVLKGGGPGTEVPYRIYIDSGYVFVCLVSLAPLTPLIGIFGMLYFVLVSPMIRWMLVFSYRPRFDGGGDKWPKLHKIIITSLLWGQLLTCLVFLLKMNILEGIIIGLSIVPTLLYNDIILEKYLPPYKDAALLQTGRLHHNWSSNSSSWQEREEMRRWLVDCHKASYVPTCLAGGNENLITAEPAVTEPTDDEQNDVDINISSVRKFLERQSTQKGGIIRRQKFNVKTSSAPPCSGLI